MFLHGAGQSRRAWDDTARAVAAHGWHAITVDHRGHGDSDWPNDPDYDWDHFADDVTAIAEHLHATPVLVGASLGGCRRCCTGQNGRTALPSSGAGRRHAPNGAERCTAHRRLHGSASRWVRLTRGGLGDHRRVHRTPATTHVRRPDPGADREPRRPVALALGHPIPRRTGRGHPRRRPRRPASHPDGDRLHDGARRIRVPTLVVAAPTVTSSPPRASEEFVHAVPGARYVDVADAGHMVAGDQNDQFTAAVLTFLGELRADARTH
ncbi:MAG: alpha/beta hydrolase [Acidimicrobiia bacterium]|nr:alpha/beta hydrolase [Acidimicrobiia bacterium]